MKFVNRTVHFSPHDMLIMVGDNIDPYYKDSLPEVALMPFSDSIMQSDRRVVGVIMESRKFPRLTIDFTQTIQEVSIPPTLSKISKLEPAKNKGEIINGISEIFRIPIAFFKVDTTNDLVYINEYIKTIELYSDYGMEFQGEVKDAKSHYNNIRSQCKIQEGITDFKVKTQIYDMVFV